MTSIANAGLPVIPLFQAAFATVATFTRAQLLGVAAILTTGRRTITNLLRTVAGLTEGDPSSYHRVLSLAQWSGLALATLLTRFLLRSFWPAGKGEWDQDGQDHPLVPPAPGRVGVAGADGVAVAGLAVDLLATVFGDGVIAG